MQAATITPSALSARYVSPQQGTQEIVSQVEINLICYQNASLYQKC